MNQPKLKSEVISHKRVLKHPATIREALPPDGVVQTLTRAAQIVETYRKLCPGSSVGVCSGGFDPLHPGHASYIDQGAHLCGFLVVVVNGDQFLTRKKGKPFMSIQDRCLVVAGIHGVDLVVPYESDADDTVCGPLEILDPDMFFKGGDRTSVENIPEWEMCQKNDIEVVTDVGDPKLWSSRNYTKEWTQWAVDQYKKSLNEA